MSMSFTLFHHPKTRGLQSLVLLTMYCAFLLFTAFFQGCAPVQDTSLTLPPPLTPEKTASPDTLATTASESGLPARPGQVEPGEEPAPSVLPSIQARFTQMPARQGTRPATQPLATTGKLSLPIQATATVNLHDMPVPAFINELYGNILQIPFQLDPEVAKLNDLVTLRTIEAQSSQDLYDLGMQVLTRYGIGAEKTGDLLYFAPAKKIGAETPLIVSGRTLPDVPVTHRPIFMLVPLHVVKAKEADQWLNQAFAGQNIKIQGDPDRNNLILMGPPDLVNQSLAAISMLDQPFMRGRFSLRINPEHFNPTDLSAQLTRVLQAEGYHVSTSPADNSGIFLLPIENANTVLAFAVSQEMIDHVKQWVLALDIPNPRLSTAARQSIFFYDVQNTSVTSLADTLNAILKGQQDASRAARSIVTGSKESSQEQNSPASSIPPAEPALPETGTVVADELRNSLVFRGSSEEWTELMQVIRRFDRPSKQVLIEVTIAEITFSDSLEKGVEWQVYLNQNKQIPSPLVSSNRESAGISSGSAGKPAQGPLSKDTPAEMHTLAQQTVRTLLNPYTLINFGTVDGLGLPKNGFTFTLESAGHTKAILNAFARDNRVNIISTPRVLVKSGMEAKIEVGTDVPTVTASQSSSGFFDENSRAGLIQSIEYRKTGVLLGVKPIVYSGNRIDLAVSQEISDISSQAVSNISSPAILSRKIETDVTLADGGSVLLGGLISSTTSEETRGIPLLKDIPLLGQLFRTDSKSNSRSMVVMLIVPYIIENQSDATAITEALKKRLDIRLEDPLQPVIQSRAKRPGRSKPVLQGH